MSPLTHFVGSWLITSATTKNSRDRKLITLAGVAPDLDGLGIAGDFARSIVTGEPNNFHLYQHYHHLLCHGWPGALVICGLLAVFARRRPRTFALCLLTFHLHLLCDLLGSRGPTPGDLWPILYSEPLYRQPMWYWQGQWRLDGWQNQIIFIIVFATSVWRAVRTGNSFVEVFSQKGDAIFVRVLRKWSDALKFSRRN